MWQKDQQETGDDTPKLTQKGTKLYPNGKTCLAPSTQSGEDYGHLEGAHRACVSSISVLSSTDPYTLGGKITIPSSSCGLSPGGICSRRSQETAFGGRPFPYYTVTCCTTEAPRGAVPLFQMEHQTQGGGQHSGACAGSVHTVSPAVLLDRYRSFLYQPSGAQSGYIGVPAPRPTGGCGTHGCIWLGLRSPSWDPLGPNRFTPSDRFWPGGRCDV